RADHDVLLAELGIRARQDGDDTARRRSCSLHADVDRRGRSHVATGSTLYRFSEQCARDLRRYRDVETTAAESAAATACIAFGRMAGSICLPPRILHRVIEH